MQSDLTQPVPPPLPVSAPASAPASAPDSLPRGLQIALTLMALLWALAAHLLAVHAAQGLAVHFGFYALEALLEALFFLFLIVVGLETLDWIATRGRDSFNSLPLPARASRIAEWGTGAALGWALCLAAVLPLLLSRNFHASMHLQPSSAAAIALALLTLLLSTLASEAVFRGYALQRLSAGVGPAAASILLSLVFAITLIDATSIPHHLLLALMDGFFLGIVLCAAWLRTHALWLGWGLHFAYRAIAAVVLGLPVAGRGLYGSLLDSYTTGPRWLSGGAFGLDATLLTTPVLLAGFAALFPLTRDWAWHYTHRPIQSAGYEVVVQPPAAHTAMEQQAAAAPPPLVQILASTPTTRSVAPAPDKTQAE